MNICCLIFSAKHEPYVSRRLHTKDTFTIVNRLIPTFYVYGNSENVKLESNELFVPVKESWENLPAKVVSAYTWAKAQGYSTVLKLDDDQICTDEDMLMRITELTRDSNGIYGGNCLKMSEFNHMMYYHLFRQKTVNIPFIQTMPTLQFADGPCYLLSGKALDSFLEYMSRDNLPPEVHFHEDLAVGYACYINNFHPQKLDLPFESAGIDTSIGSAVNIS